MLKRSVSGKPLDNESKVLTESNTNTKVTADTKNLNIARNTYRAQHTAVNRSKSEIQISTVNNENCLDTSVKKNSDHKKDTEVVKNQINTNLNKNVATNNIR